MKNTFSQRKHFSAIFPNDRVLRQSIMIGENVKNKNLFMRFLCDIKNFIYHILINLTT